MQWIKYFVHSLTLRTQDILQLPEPSCCSSNLLAIISIISVRLVTGVVDAGPKWDSASNRKTLLLGRAGEKLKALQLEEKSRKNSKTKSFVVKIPPRGNRDTTSMIQWRGPAGGAPKSATDELISDSCSTGSKEAAPSGGRNKDKPHTQAGPWQYPPPPQMHAFWHP